MDPVTVLGSGLAILGSQPILTKVLGPTADYLGGELKNVVDRCNINLDRVLQRAVQVLGSKIEQPGSVPPRVLKHVVEEARFVEDELSAQYYGGLLAAGRSNQPRDDRALTYLAAVKDLSTYQIRMHYVVYSVFRSLCRAQGITAFRARTSRSFEIFLPIDSWDTAMGGLGDEFEAILVHCIVGLQRLDLLGDRWQYGNDEQLKKVDARLRGGLILQPSVFGAALFLWASGVRGATGREILEAETVVVRDEVELPKDAILLKAPEEKT